MDTKRVILFRGMWGTFLKLISKRFIAMIEETHQKGRLTTIYDNDENKIDIAKKLIQVSEIKDKWLKMHFRVIFI